MNLISSVIALSISILGCIIVGCSILLECLLVFDIIISIIIICKNGSSRKNKKINLDTLK